MIVVVVVGFVFVCGVVGGSDVVLPLHALSCFFGCLMFVVRNHLFINLIASRIPPGSVVVCCILVIGCCFCYCLCCCSACFVAFSVLLVLVLVVLVGVLIWFLFFFLLLFCSSCSCS